MSAPAESPQLNEADPQARFCLCESYARVTERAALAGARWLGRKEAVSTPFGTTTVGKAGSAPRTNASSLAEVNEQPENLRPFPWGSPWTRVTHPSWTPTAPIERRDRRVFSRAKQQRSPRFANEESLRAMSWLSRA